MMIRCNGKMETVGMTCYVVRPLVVVLGKCMYPAERQIDADEEKHANSVLDTSRVERHFIKHKTDKY